LALGTVQFGLPYGSRRPSQPVSVGEVQKLLAAAHRAGVDMLDTAPAYGAAEKLIGDSCDGSEGFQVVSKTVRVPEGLDAKSAVAEVCRRVRASAAYISPAAFYAVLVHNEDELIGPHGDLLFAKLSQLKSQGLFSKIGASFYTPKALLDTLDRYPIDIAQVPFNVFDQRFVAPSTLARIARANIELHARSIYLQGYLLRAPDTYPQHLVDLRETAQRLRADLARAGLSPMAACLGAALVHPQIARIVVGCDSVDDFDEMLAAAKTVAETESWPDWTKYALTVDAVDPRNWPSSGS
jgi:L-glyceraldehyde 3-phosphate reductase